MRGRLVAVVAFLWGIGLWFSARMMVGWSSSRSMQAVSNGRGQAIQKVAMLFLIKDEVFHKEIWQYWIEEAVAWSQQNLGYNAVTTYVHPKLGVDEKLLSEQLPRALRESVVPSAECRWGYSNPCMAQLLKSAYEDDAENQFFVYISQSTIPVVLFSEVFMSFQENPRSRIFISNLNFLPYPKHDQWIILSRRHAGLLLEHIDKWTRLRPPGRRPAVRYPTGRSQVASDNEQYLLGTLLDVAESRESLWKELNYGLQMPEYQNTTMRRMWDETCVHTFVCWKGPCLEMGLKVEGRRPAFYTVIYPEKFDQWITNSRSYVNATYWFARKFTADVKVLEGDAEILVHEWLIPRLQAQGAERDGNGSWQALQGRKPAIEDHEELPTDDGGDKQHDGKEADVPAVGGWQALQGRKPAFEVNEEVSTDESNDKAALRGAGGAEEKKSV